MSNFLAVATVTATLKYILNGVVGADVSGATATADRPDQVAKNSAFIGVNIYLYQVTPNAALRNADLPTRRADGSLAQKAQAALDLYYLFSFYGDETDFTPERVLGSVVRTLHSQPTLSPAQIQQAINANPGSLLTPQAQSDLASSIELVRLTPIALNLEELSKLWSVFFQTSYILSVAYRASLVLIESEDTPQVAPPVLQRQLYVLPFKQPLIERVEPQMIDVTNNKLMILGQNLLADQTVVRFGDAEAVPDPGSTPQQLIVTAPASLQAGILAAQVVQPIFMGLPPVRHTGVEFESNAAPFVLRPTITSPVNVTNVQGTGNNPRSADLTLQVAPSVGKDQRVILLLNDASGNMSTTYTFAAPARTADTTTLTIHAANLPAGDYLARLRVDDADSALATDTHGKYTGPKVTIP